MQNMEFQDNLTELTKIVEDLEQGGKLTRTKKSKGLEALLLLDANATDPATEAKLKQAFGTLKPRAAALLSAAPLELSKADILLYKQDRQSKIIRKLLDELTQEVEQHKKDELKHRLELELDIFKKQDDALLAADPDFSHVYFTSNEFLATVNDVNTQMARNTGKSEAIINPSQSQIHPTALPPSLPLPRLTIKPFEGGSQEWVIFKDSFKNLIMDRNIQEPEKLVYLKSYLSGAPAKLLTNLASTSPNCFTQAWAILTNTFENRKSIVYASLSRIADSSRLHSDLGLKQLVDKFRNEVEILRSQEVNIDHNQIFLVYHLISKLDAITRKDFETAQADAKSIPDLPELLNFLDRRISALSNNQDRRNPTQKFSLHVKNKPNKASNNQQIKKPNTCLCCNSPWHPLFQCQHFLKMLPAKRFQLCKKATVCINCLKTGHVYANCPSEFKCKKCNEKHNTLLHFEKAKKIVFTTHTSEDVILATATARIYSPVTGKFKVARVLFDQGSEATLIRKDVCDFLNLDIRGPPLDIQGLGGGEQESFGTYKFIIRPRVENPFKLTMKADVLEDITEVKSSEAARAGFDRLFLADENGEGGEVDLLIGAKYFPKLLVQGQFFRGIMAQDTRLGHILSGRVAHTPMKVHHLTLEAINKKMDHLFTLSEPELDNHVVVQSHYNSTTIRRSDGRYQVELPFIQYPPVLGQSVHTAKARLNTLMKTLIKLPEAYAGYAKFMTEYIQLGHMSEICYSQAKYFLPHHPVYKDSSTTKLRVVFDASSPTDNGRALNDCMENGPVLQKDMHNVLTGFRKYRFTISGDLEKMFRQIMFAPQHRPYQCILWHDKAYQLNTVTYGTKPATYLAVKTLFTLANDEKEDFPEAHS